MATFGSYDEYDEFLAMQGDAQRYKLKLNAHKGFLGDVPPEALLAKLKEEVVELEEAYARGSSFDMLLELADISNFALGMMISAMRLKRKQKDAGTGIEGTELRPTLGRAA